MKDDKNKGNKHNSKKTEKELNIQIKKVRMSIKSSIPVTISANLTEALNSIDKHPNSIEVNNNYIRFSVEENELLEFQRLFFNSWSIKLNTKYKFIFYKYLSTNAVKAIIINLYYGNTLLDLINQDMKREKINRTLSNVIHIIETYIISNITCHYCNHKIAKIEQERCDYCGIELNLQRFLYQNIFA